MENYGEFAQRCLSKLKKNEEEHRRPPSASSLIRYCGRAILPPLLSEEQREEMRRLREKATASQKLRDDPRMAYLQALLHSVQLRKTPTMQELLKESEAGAGELSSLSASCSGAPDGAGSGKLTNGIVLRPQTTSITYRACFHSHVSPQQSYHLPEQLDGQLGPPPCSSDAAGTQENQEITAATGGETEAGEAKETDSTGGFFLHSTPNTIAKMAAIISHPPIDGEELERTGMESFFCTNVLGARDPCLTSFHVDSAERPDLSPPPSLNKKVHSPAVAQLNPAGGGSAERNDGLPALSGGSGLWDGPDSQQTLNLTRDIHVEKTPSKGEPEPADASADRQRAEKTHPMSLQALLKKSQEYRRQQRMLRNQARNAKILQERTGEEPNMQGEEPKPRREETNNWSFRWSEEPNLSDKENDEGPVMASTEERGVSIRPEEHSAQKSWKTSIIQSDGKNESEDGETVGRLCIEEETSSKNKRNRSPEVTVTPKWVGVLTQQQPGSVGGTLSESRRLSSAHRKYRSVPAPSFCLSPAPCKGKAVHAASEPKPDSRSDFSGNRATDPELDLQPSPTAAPPVNVTGEDGAVSVFAKSSLHIDELEANLRSLKVLISDLESTVREDSEHVGNAGQEDSSGCLEDAQEVDDPWRRRSDHREGSDVTKLSQVTGGGAGEERRHSINSMSAAHQLPVPRIFRNVPSSSILSDPAGNVPAEAGGPAPSPSLNQSYDVDAPSDLWFQEAPGSDPGSQGHRAQAHHFTPESGGEDLPGVSKVKRRLLMQEKNEGLGRAADAVAGPDSSAQKGRLRWSEGCSDQKQEELKQIHAAQVRALQEQHRKQQEELLQVLAARYRLLRDASPCSTSAPRCGDTLTSSSLPHVAPEPLSPLSQHCRPLLAAAVKGFLTRRLLRTERVAQLLRTVRDTQQFLQAFQQQQSASRGERCSRPDVLLQERVALQLRAARYEVYDIFFSLSAREQMQLIRWDRELARERQLRRQNGPAACPRGKSSLSAATQKSLERKRARLIQKKAAECHRGAPEQTGQKCGFSAKKPQQTKRGQFKANPQRVPKSVCSSRPR